MLLCDKVINGDNKWSYTYLILKNLVPVYIHQNLLGHTLPNTYYFVGGDSLHNQSLEQALDKSSTHR